MSDLPSWIDRFSGLSSLSAQLRTKLTKVAKRLEVAKGKRIFGPGQAPENLLLLLEGTIRVQQISEGGREIFLYRVEAGDSCVLTSACLLAYEDYSAEGLAETDIVVMAVPKSMFEELLSTSSEFRRFVFTAYSRRITDLFKIIDEVAFGHIDIRLAKALVRKLNNEGRLIKTTQQELAAELGTAREVISRQLQEFKRRGWLGIGRGSIEVLQSAALKELAKTR